MKKCWSIIPHNEIQNPIICHILFNISMSFIYITDVFVKFIDLLFTTACDHKTIQDRNYI